jgi:hypothetical protein
MCCQAQHPSTGACLRYAKTRITSCRAHLPVGMRAKPSADACIKLGFQGTAPLAGGAGGAVAPGRRPRRAPAPPMPMAVSERFSGLPHDHCTGSWLCYAKTWIVACRASLPRAMRAKPSADACIKLGFQGAAPLAGGAGGAVAPGRRPRRAPAPPMPIALIEGRQGRMPLAGGHPEGTRGLAPNRAPRRRTNEQTNSCRRSTTYAWCCRSPSDNTTHKTCYPQRYTVQRSIAMPWFEKRQQRP